MACVSLVLTSCATITPQAQGGERVWRSLRTPRAIVLSDLDEERAVAAAQSVEQLSFALEELLFPYAEKPAEPVEVIVFAEQEDFRVGVVDWAEGQFRPNVSWSPGTSGQILLRGPQRDWNRDRLVHELTHRYVHYYYPEAPVWLDEGLAQFAESLHFEGDTASLGGSHRFLDDQRPPTAVFSLSRRDFYLADATDDDSAFQRAANYSCAWRAVHALAAPETGALHAAFEDYLRRLAAMTPAPEAFASAFAAFSPQALGDAIRLHRRGRRFTIEKQLSAPSVAPKVQLLSRDDGRSVWLLHQAIGPRAADREAARNEIVARTETGTPSASLLRLRSALEEEHPERLLLLARRVYHAEQGRPDALGILVSALEFDPAANPAERDGLVEKLALAAETTEHFAVVAVADLANGQLDRAARFAKRATDRAPGCVGCWAIRAAVHDERREALHAQRARALALALADDEELLREIERKIAKIRANFLGASPPAGARR